MENDQNQPEKIKISIDERFSTIYLRKQATLRQKKYKFLLKFKIKLHDTGKQVDTNNKKKKNASSCILIHFYTCMCVVWRRVIPTSQLICWRIKQGEHKHNTIIIAIDLKIKKKTVESVFILIKIDVTKLQWKKKLQRT